MNIDYTSVPYFPANLEDYAPWVATHGLVAPYGKCQCGCGEDASVAKKTNNEKGRRKGCPVRFIHGHNAVPSDDAPKEHRACSVCKQVKHRSSYYTLKTGKFSYVCKECSRLLSLKRHHANRNEILQRQAKYRAENKEFLVRRERERRENISYREIKAKNIRNWRDRNKEHVYEYNRSLPVKARGAVNKLIRNGRLPSPKWMICNGCLESLADHYHHFNGYEKEHWFDIEPLCTECHGRKHRINESITGRGT